MSFGTLTRMYRGMQRADQRAIAARYGLQNADFGSHPLAPGLRAQSYVLTTPAFGIVRVVRQADVAPRPDVAERRRCPETTGCSRTLCLIQHLLNRCPPVAGFAVQWRDRLLQRLVKLPNTPQALARMGMPANWIQHPVWK